MDTFDLDEARKKRSSSTVFDLDAARANKSATTMPAAAFNAAPDSAEMGMRMGLGGSPEIEVQARAAAAAAPIIATGGLMHLPLVPAALAGGAIGYAQGGAKGALLGAGLAAVPGAGRLLPGGVKAKLAALAVEAIKGAGEAAPTVETVAAEAPAIAKVLGSAAEASVPADILQFPKLTNDQLGQFIATKGGKLGEGLAPGWSHSGLSATIAERAPEVAKALSGAQAEAAALEAAHAARIGANSTAAQSTADDIHAFVLKQLKAGQSRGQIRDSIRQLFGIKDSAGAQMIGMIKEAEGL